jgi:bacterioferritin-associated ferredoxin
MILCVCNAVTEDEVRNAARKGATCPRAAFRSLGQEPQCCACLCYAQEVIDEERQAIRGVNARVAA